MARRNTFIWCIDRSLARCSVRSTTAPTSTRGVPDASRTTAALRRTQTSLPSLRR